MLTDEYRTLKQYGEGSYSELRSKFLAFAYPVTSADEAASVIAETRRKYYDARHVAYAYIIGYGGTQYRANDDGEPSGTAGKPILGQIRSNELTDVLIVVVRYFGGVKLGTSRLAEAYRAAAADALSHSEMVVRRITETICVRFAYESMNGVMKALRDCDARVVENVYDEGCKILAEVRKSKLDDLCARLSKIEVTISLAK